VIGGGVTGQRAALDLVHAGLKTLLIERGASLGGTVAQLGTMFPLHNCLLCRGETRHGPGCTRPTISSELLDRGRPDGLSVWTQSRLLAVEGGPGEYLASIRREPRYVDAARCISCDRCAEACPQTLPDPFQAGLVSRKAAYKPSERAVPDAYAIQKGPYCEGCGRCVAACPTEAVSLYESPRAEKVAVSAVVLATGMRLSDPLASREYGYGRYPNVYSGLEMESMTSLAGPGEGRILRRSDGKAPERIAWVQCVGSRDRTHDYCSSFCCGYATRQAVTARGILPSAQMRIFMMDDRVAGKDFSATYEPLRRDYDVRLERCRLSVLREDPVTHDLILQFAGEDGRVTEERFGMVALSVGATAALEASELCLSLGVKADDFGFVRTETLAPVDTARTGIFVAGTAAGPADIADSVTQGSAAAARVCSFLGRNITARRSGQPLLSLSAADGTGQRRRIGVLACRCAEEIGAVVDLPRAMGFAAALPDVAVAQIVPYGCLTEGINAIRRVASEYALTDVVIGACNRRTYLPLFEKSIDPKVQFVSLREECAYVHRTDKAGATRKACELIRIAVERLRHDAPTPAGQPITPARAVLVIGGGIAGLTAALHLAGAGVPVHLVEREAVLGGNALRLNRTPEGADIHAHVEALAARAEKHPRVTLHISSEVVRHDGHAGQFSATVRAIRGQPKDVILRVGATVVATGGEEYRGPAYGLGKLQPVITLLDLVGRLRAEPDLPGRLRQISFIGCTGPWDEPAAAIPWRCSRTCCETMIGQARIIKEANPSCQVVVLAREVNTYGFREEEYTTARKAGVLFVRFPYLNRPRLEMGAGGLCLSVLDAALGEELAFRPDLVVLAEASLPRVDSIRAAARLGIPVGSDGFLKEWEAKTRRFSSMEPGVFVCGLAQGPKPLREVITQALAASQQALTLISNALAPAGVVARVDAKRCAVCLTCVRVCPYGVPRIEDPLLAPGKIRRRSVIDPARCQGCGICAAECPAKAIQLDRNGDELLIGGGLLGRWLTAS
jgi:heterodisulfide reductase subunit A